MATLGQDLKQERELRAISINDIAGQTKISLRYLQALEDDRLDLLPGTFFIKSVLRAYSRSLGVDENRFVNKYHEDELLRHEDDKENERRRRDVKRPERKPRKERKERQERSRNARWRWAAVFAVLIAAIAFAAYVFILKPQRDNRPVIPRPAAAPPLETPLPPARQEPVADPDDPAKAEELKLELTFTAATWIQVAADGQVLMEATKKAGDTAVFQAKKQFLIQTGNAGGFTYMINGRRGVSLGPSGSVRTDIWIHRENLKEFMETR